MMYVECMESEKKNDYVRVWMFSCACRHGCLFVCVCIHVRMYVCVRVLACACG